MIALTTRNLKAVLKAQSYKIVSNIRYTATQVHEVQTFQIHREDRDSRYCDERNLTFLWTSER